MNQDNQNEDQEFQEEYRRIKSDVIKVILSNLLILALLIAAYFVNQKTNFLDQFQKLF